METLLFDFQHIMFQTVTQQSGGFVFLCFVFYWFWSIWGFSYNWSWFFGYLEVQKSRELPYGLSQWPVSCVESCWWVTKVSTEKTQQTKVYFLEISLPDEKLSALRKPWKIHVMLLQCFPWPFYYRCGWLLALNMWCFTLIPHQLSLEYYRALHKAVN